MSDNIIGIEGIILLSDVLATNNTLIELLLNENNFSEGVMLCLKKGLLFSFLLTLIFKVAQSFNQNKNLMSS